MARIPVNIRRGFVAKNGMAKSNRKNTSSRESLAANLRAARSLFGWSQEELGFECGLKRTYIGALERHEVNPGIDNLDKLAVGMGLHPCTLLLDPTKAYSEIYQAASTVRRSARR